MGHLSMIVLCLYFMRQGLSLNLKLVDLAKLATCLQLIPPVLGLQTCTNMELTSLFLGIQTWVIMFEFTSVYQLSHYFSTHTVFSKH